jgi:nicotinate-nucleotide pyrophosphorylase (carboxylating)
MNRLLYADLVKLALAEDLGRGGDLTTDLVFDAGHRSSAVFRAREEGVLAGLEAALEAFRQLSADVTVTGALADVTVTGALADGAALAPGMVIARIAGPTRALLTGERTALNILGHLSGIATRTRRLVDAVAGTRAAITDTRKTLPGLRALQKYAVTVGGGRNHRFGLDDAVLLKDNHIAACGSLTEAVRRVRAGVGHTVKIEVEVDNLTQFDEALALEPEIILLDNFTPADLRTAVARRDAALVRRNHVLLEASGRVTEATVRALAETGVDLISLGALTHSVTVLDIGLDDQ